MDDVEKYALDQYLPAADIGEAAHELVMEELEKLGGLPTGYMIMELPKSVYSAFIIYRGDDLFGLLSFDKKIKLSFIWFNDADVNESKYIYEYADPKFANDLASCLLERIARHETPTC